MNAKATKKKTKAPDENDLLRAGKLPLDPDEGCEDVPPPVSKGARARPSFERRDLPPFPVDVFPPVIKGVIEAAAEGFHGPAELAALPAMAVFAAALGPRWVCGPRGMQSSPAVWPVVVAPSGSAKTPTSRPLVAPLYELDVRLRQEYENAHDAWAETERRGRKGRAPVSEGDASRPEPQRRRLVVTDTTPEGLLVELAKAEGHGLLLHTDELPALLSSMDGYKSSGGRGGRSTWLSLWSGSPIRSIRKTAAGAECDRPFVAVLGGVQPSVLRALELADGDGLCSRFLWAHVPPKAGTRGDGLTEPAASTWRRAVELAARHVASDPQALATKDGLALFDARVLAWRERAVELDGAGMGLSSSFYGKAAEVLVRLLSLLHGMDLVCEALEGPVPDLATVAGRGVPTSTLERAVRLADYFLEHGLETARLVTARGPRESDAVNDDDEGLAAALLALVRPGEAIVDTPAGWRERLSRCGAAPASPEATGRRLTRLSVTPPEGLTVRRRAAGSDGKARGWEVKRAPSGRPTVPTVPTVRARTDASASPCGTRPPTVPTVPTVRDGLSNDKGGGYDAA